MDFSFYAHEKCSEYANSVYRKDIDVLRSSSGNCNASELRQEMMWNTKGVDLVDWTFS